MQSVQDGTNSNRLAKATTITILIITTISPRSDLVWIGFRLLIVSWDLAIRRRPHHPYCTAHTICNLFPKVQCFWWSPPSAKPKGAIFLPFCNVYNRDDKIMLLGIEVHKIILGITVRELQSSLHFSWHWALLLQLEANPTPSFSTLEEKRPSSTCSQSFKLWHLNLVNCQVVGVEWKI